MSAVLDAMIALRKTKADELDKLVTSATAEGRTLSADEAEQFDRRSAELKDLDARAQSLAEDEQRARDLEAHLHTDARNGGRAPEAVTGDRSPEFEQFLRQARVGDHYDLQGKVDQRAVVQGTSKPNAVYSQLWEFAIQASEILSAGVTLVETANGNTIPMPVVSAHAQAASSTGFGALLPESNPSFGTVDLGATKYAYFTDVPNELFQDEAFDLEGYITRAAGRELGRVVGAVATSAALAGFTTTGATIATGSLGTSAFSNALIDLYYSVLPTYRNAGAWLASDPAQALLRKTVDGSGQYVWSDALTVGQPATVLGRAIYTGVGLPAPTGTATPVLFGDFSALAVRIAGGLRVERSDQVGFKNDVTTFRVAVRTGAVVLDPNAVKGLKLTAS